MNNIIVAEVAPESNLAIFWFNDKGLGRIIPFKRGSKVLNWVYKSFDGETIFRVNGEGV